MRFIPRLACCAAAVALSACSPVTGEDNELRRPGILVHFESEAVISVPAEVRAGERFTVAVTTFGPSSCFSEGDTRVNVRGSTAYVAPFDIHYAGEGISCADILRMLTHEAELVFNTPGPATVRIQGTGEPDQDDIVVTRTVNVLPAS